MDKSELFQKKEDPIGPGVGEIGLKIENFKNKIKDSFTIQG